MGEHADSHPGAMEAQQPRTWVRPPHMPDMAPISQLALAYPFLSIMWFVCMMSASAGYEFLGSLIFLFIGGAFFMAAGVALGLPVRLNRRLSRWWLGNAPVYILLAAAGAALILAGFNTPERQVGDIDGYHYDVVTPHGGLLMGGCFIVTFVVVNASFPLRWPGLGTAGRVAQDSRAKTVQ